MMFFRCPRCNKAPIYKGMTTVVDVCASCCLPIKEHEQGDGPAFFAIVLVGGLVGIFASIVEIRYAPPFWVHAALWIPFIVIGSIFAIRFFKATLIAAQYKWRREDFN